MGSPGRTSLATCRNTGCISSGCRASPATVVAAPTPPPPPAWTLPPTTSSPAHPCRRISSTPEGPIRSISCHSSPWRLQCSTTTRWRRWGLRRTTTRSCSSSSSGISETPPQMGSSIFPSWGNHSHRRCRGWLRRLYTRPTIWNRLLRRTGKKSSPFFQPGMIEYHWAKFEIIDLPKNQSMSFHCEISSLFLAFCVNSTNLRWLLML